ISICGERARQAAVIWVETGHVTGVPQELPAEASVTGVDAGMWPSTDNATTRLQAKGRDGGPTLTGANPEAIRTGLGQGEPLDSASRSRMENAFGCDFSSVRVHTDSHAAVISSDLSARAFTIGTDIAFGANEYAPGNPVGDALLAHELAHVVQQRGSALSAVGGRDGQMGEGQLEQDADNSAL